MSHKYFGIKDEPNFKVVAEDGRTFLTHSGERYDLILIDAYRGPFVPFHLLTREFYELVRNHLNDGGAVGQNIEPSTMLFDSAVMTINSVFPNVDFYYAGGNVVTIAYPGKAISKDELAALARERQDALRLRYDLNKIATMRSPFVPSQGMVDVNAKTLTDDFAPVETLKAIENHNRKWSDK